MVDFPVIDLEENQPAEAMSIGFSTGSGHDLEGDIINIDGKNWTVRGESILDYWMVDTQNQSDVDSIDMIVTDSGTTFACSPDKSHRTKGPRHCCQPPAIRTIHQSSAIG